MPYLPDYSTIFEKEFKWNTGIMYKHKSQQKIFTCFYTKIIKNLCKFLTTFAYFFMLLIILDLLLFNDQVNIDFLRPYMITHSIILVLSVACYYPIQFSENYYIKNLAHNLSFYLSFITYLVCLQTQLFYGGLEKEDYDFKFFLINIINTYVFVTTYFSCLEHIYPFRFGILILIRETCDVYVSLNTNISKTQIIFTVINNVSYSFAVFYAKFYFENIHRETFERKMKLSMSKRFFFSWLDNIKLGALSFEEKKPFYWNVEFTNMFSNEIRYKINNKDNKNPNNPDNKFNNKNKNDSICKIKIKEGFLSRFKKEANNISESKKNISMHTIPEESSKKSINNNNNNNEINLSTDLSEFINDFKKSYLTNKRIYNKLDNINAYNNKPNDDKYINNKNNKNINSKNFLINKRDSNFDLKNKYRKESSNKSKSQSNSSGSWKNKAFSSFKDFQYLGEYSYLNTSKPNTLEKIKKSILGGDKESNSDDKTSNIKHYEIFARITRNNVNHKLTIDIMFYEITLIKLAQAQQTEGKLKSSIFNKVAHEIKTPLITIMSQIQEIIEDLEVLKQKYNNLIVNTQETKTLMSYNDLTKSNFHGFNKAEKKVSDCYKRIMEELNSNYKISNKHSNSNILYSNNRYRTENLNKTNNNKYSLANTTNVNNLLNYTFNNNELDKLINKSETIYNLSQYTIYLISDLIQYSNCQKLTNSLLISKQKYDSIEKSLVTFMKGILHALLTFSTGNKTNINGKILTSSDLDKYYIYTDMEKLKQVLVNILANSIKFTKSGEIIIDFFIDKKNSNPCDLYNDQV